MKVLNFGSLNIDYVYTVDHIVQGRRDHLFHKDGNLSRRQGAEPVHRPGKGRGSRLSRGGPWGKTEKCSWISAGKTG